MGYTVEFKDFPSGTGVVGAFDMAPEAAVAFMRDKGLKPTFHYLDMLAEEHVHAFTVAKMMDTDLLADVQEKVTQIIEEGADIQRFRRELTPFLQEKGWWGKTTMTDPLTGQATAVQLGSAHRLNTIFRTNVQSAYAVGQWEMIDEQKADAPWLMYDAVDDWRTRPMHAAWDNTILPVTHPWWSTHYPPNGYNCRCGTIQLDGDQLEALGMKPTKRAPNPGYREWTNPRTGKTFKIPEGVDPGFANNVGIDRLERIKTVLTEKIQSLPGPMQAAAPAVDELAQTAWTKGLKAAEARLENISPETAALQELAQIENTNPPYLGAALTTLQKQKQWQGASPSELLAAVKAKADKSKQSAALAHYKQAKLKGKEPGPEAQAAYDSLPDEAQADLDAGLNAKLNQAQAEADAQAKLDDIAANPQGQTLKAKALENLKASGNAEGMTAQALLDQVEEIAAAQQAKATKAAALSGYKKKVLEGKTPTPAQTAAYKSLTEDEQADFIQKLDQAKAEQAAQQWWDAIKQADAGDFADTAGATAVQQTKAWLGGLKKAPKATVIKSKFDQLKAKAEAEAPAPPPPTPEPAAPDIPTSVTYYDDFPADIDTVSIEADRAVDVFVEAMGEGAYGESSRQALKAWVAKMLDPAKGDISESQWTIAKIAADEVIEDTGVKPFNLVLAQLRDASNTVMPEDAGAALRALIDSEMGDGTPRFEVWGLTKARVKAEAFVDKLVEGFEPDASKLDLRNAVMEMLAGGKDVGYGQSSEIQVWEALGDAFGGLDQDFWNPLWEIAERTGTSRLVAKTLDTNEVMPADVVMDSIDTWKAQQAGGGSPQAAPPPTGATPAAPEAPEPPQSAAGASADVPEPPDTPEATIHPEAMTKTGAQEGSNAGGFYRDTETGIDWYIKKPASEDMARNEVLAAKLYEAAGVEVPDVRLIDFEGQKAVASRVIPNLKQVTGQTLAKKAGAHDGFMVDAWLGDWDAVGTGFDNMKSAGNRAVRIDVGGSLRYRAQGGLKSEGQWGPKVTEIDTLRDPKMNEYAAPVFRGITREKMIEGARRVGAISDDQIDRLVARHGPADPDVAEKLALTLRARRDDILERFPEARTTARAEPLPDSVDDAIAPAESALIDEARQNGYVIRTDLDEIEDQQVLLWRQRDAGGTLHTKADLKLRGTGVDTIERQLRTASDKPNVPELTDVDSQILEAVRGLASVAAKEGLRDKDIARVTQALEKGKKARARIEGMIGEGLLDAKSLENFDDHYGFWLRSIEHAVINRPVGEKIQYLPPGKFEIGQDILVEGASKTPSTPGIQWTRSSDAPYKLAKIERGYAQDFGRGQNVGDSTHYVAKLDDGTVLRYFPTANKSLAVRNRLIIETPTGEVAGAERVFSALERIGINRRRPTALEQEDLYLTQIAYHRRDGFESFQSRTESITDVGERVQAKKDILSEQMLGERIEAMPGYRPLGDHEPFGHGRVRRYRPDVGGPAWESFRKNYRLHHEITNGSLPDTIEAILNSGGNLVATADKLRRGIQVGGMSPDEDMRTGGAGYVFTRIKSTRSGQRPGLYWKADHVARLDAISYDGDRYGNVEAGKVQPNRKTGIEEWKKAAGQNGNETILKGNQSIFDRFDKIQTSDRMERERVLAIFREHGITQWPDGRSLEDVIQ